MSRSPNVRLPEMPNPPVVPRTTPVPPEPVTPVVPKLSVAPAAVVTVIPTPVGFVTVVVVIVRLPCGPLRLMPVVVLLVDVTVVKVIPSVVALRLIAGPLVDAIEPVVTFTVPFVLPETPVPLLVVTASDVNDTVFVGSFDVRFTPVPAVVPLFTVVAPKPKVDDAPESVTTIPVPPGFTMFVVGVVNDPLTPCRRTPSDGLPPLDSSRSKTEPLTIVPLR